jgi:hypothetical protein
MVEYSLIMATVVVGFAVASRLGVSSAFVNRLNDAQQNYSVIIPEDLSELQDSLKQDRFNREITLH